MSEPLSSASGDEENVLSPRHIYFENSDRLLQLLMEGIESGPATEMTREDWDQLHRRLVNRRRQPG